LNRKTKLILVVLFIASVTAQAYSIYAYATVTERNHASYFCYRAERLDYVPENYWNLTDPDPYISEAIEKLGEWTEPFYYENSTFWFTAIWDEPDAPPEPHCIHPVPFRYNETYYDYDVWYSGEYLTVNLLNEEPPEYWNLTNPDKYTMEAIENPGKRIAVGINATLNLQPGPFQYKGKYYNYSIVDVLQTYPLPKPLKPEHTATVVAVMWVVVGSVYVVSNRKKQKLNLKLPLFYCLKI
jgi:hypothetical protein